MFLGQMEAKLGILRDRVQEIRGVLTQPAPKPEEPGVTNGLRISYEIRDRLVGIQSRHGLRSSKEAIYKAMLLGLVTLERLEPLGSKVRPRRPYRALSEDEISQLKDGVRSRG